MRREEPRTGQAASKTLSRGLSLSADHRSRHGNGRHPGDGRCPGDGCASGDGLHLLSVCFRVCSVSLVLHTKTSRADTAQQSGDRPRVGTTIIKGFWFLREDQTGSGSVSGSGSCSPCSDLNQR